jgi:AmmeMemoRadiSam system protein B
MYEHSLEVELPILQYFKKEFQILPICIMSTDIKELKELGCSIAQAIKDKGIESSVLIIASSDMTHYEPKDTAEKKDKEAIEAILELDCDKLLRKVRDLDISMCGYCPTITLITAAKLLGAKSAELVKYETSASATGDTSSVVGYAGITIF